VVSTIEKRNPKKKGERDARRKYQKSAVAAL
jgi:ribosomal protein S9